MISVQELARDSFLRTTEILLKTYAAVPEDKLLWAPSSTAKSATTLVAHCGYVGMALAKVLSRTMPATLDVKAMFVELRKKESAVVTKEQAIAIVEESVPQVIAAIDGITDEQLEGDLVTPFGTRPTRRFIFVPDWHTASHSAQIDYLQTIWGDLESHN